MGTCVSKCYQTPPHPACSDSTSKPPAPAKEAAVAVHPPPLPLSPTTTTSSSLSLASTSLCASSSSSSSSSSAASSTCPSSRPRPRGLVLLPNSSSSSSSSKSREWDVVVLDPKSYSYHCSKLTSAPTAPISATPKSKAKRARSVSPLPTRRPLPPGEKQQKKRRQHGTPATEREALLVRSEGDAREPRGNKTKGHGRPPAAAARVAEDDLTNPVIAMDCFIFL